MPNSFLQLAPHRVIYPLPGLASPRGQVLRVKASTPPWRLIQRLKPASQKKHSLSNKEERFHGKNSPKHQASFKIIKEHFRLYDKDAFEAPFTQRVELKTKPPLC
jgi:hypothetical protein